MIPNISESELEIMKVLWNARGDVTTQYINKEVEEYGWKRTTISTFLTRLVEKKAVSAEKRGSVYYYTPLISQKEYRKAQTKNLIKSLYNGSIRELAVSLFTEEKLSEEDIKELRAMLDEEV